MPAVPGNAEAAAVRNKTQAAASDHVSFRTGFLRDRLDFGAGAREVIFKTLYFAAAHVLLNKHSYQGPRIMQSEIRNVPERIAQKT